MIEKKVIKKVIAFFIIIVVLCTITLFAVNAYVVNSTKNQIISSDAINPLKDIDCIVVLGCGLKSDGTPSNMLRDRLDRGIELYNAGVAEKIIMTGDHGTVDYNEVGTMKNYAIDKGIPDENIFMDHAGFSTYESIYRASAIFEAQNIVIVTQKYHLHRALHIANALGLRSYGVDSDYRIYRGQIMRDAREVLARCKDYLVTIFKPKPKYLGEKIPVSGNGNLTNDY